ncbi:hypothetical protein BC831DRAFT_550258 [Entophlyctis helioformis]|nr:hypothetical protein BC831DRAFT_550258 [Entophlyctis helioformis]
MSTTYKPFIATAPLVPMTLSSTLLQPEFTTPFALYTVVQLAVFAAASAGWPTVFGRNTRQQGWLLTLMVSALVTVLSLPFVGDVVTEVVDAVWSAVGGAGYSPLERTTVAADGQASLRIPGVFLSFLLMDVVVGSLVYPRHVQLLTGYVHHAVYAGLIIDLMRHRIAFVLCPMGLMELPTFLLALGNVVAPLRAQLHLPFGVCFVVTRLVFHAVLVWRVVRATAGQRFWIYVACTLPLHVWWFRGWLVQRSRMSARRSGSPSPTDGRGDSKEEEVVVDGEPSSAAAPGDSGVRHRAPATDVDVD